MQRHSRERGAALIMLIAITAVLAILSASLVTVLANQEHATAMERTLQTSQQYGDGALDKALTLAKTRVISKTDPFWLTSAELLQAFEDDFGGSLPAGMTATYYIYDNSGNWNQFASDANGDGMMWIEVVLTYRGKTSRMRVLLRQSVEKLITAFPKAVVYSDTGIRLLDTSDVYAVKTDGYTPWAPAPPWATTIMAGGGWQQGMPAGGKDFEANDTANLAAPTGSVQSVNIQVNGSVSPSGKFNGTITGGVGLLSDYFDQAAQADLGDEAQSGEGHSSAPAAPGAPSAPPNPSSGWVSTGYTTLNSSSTPTLSTLTSTTLTTTVNATGVDLLRSGSLTLTRGTNTTGRTFNFRKLYVTGDLTLTGPVTVNCTSLYVGGKLTVNNATTTTVSDTLGSVYVNGTTASSVAGRVNVSTDNANLAGVLPTFLRTRGPLTIANAYPATALTEQFGALYVDGALGVSGNVTIGNTASIYAGGALSLSNASTTAPQLYALGNVTLSGTGSVSSTASIYSGSALAISNVATAGGALHSSGDLSFTGNTTVTGTSVYAGGALTISGATAAITDQFSSIHIAGTGSSSVAGTVALAATNSIYAAGPLAMSNTGGTSTNGLFFAADNLSLTGNTPTKSTALVVLGGSDNTSASKDFVISGASADIVDEFGSIWVKGFADWSGNASVRTTNHLNALAVPAPMYLGILARSGRFDDVYGPTWCAGNAGTSNVAVRFTGPAAGTSTVTCRLLGTTEKTVITGRVNFGTVTNPMVYYMMCDNDTLYSNTMLLGDAGNGAPYLGTFTGLMVIMEATLEMYSNVGITPCVIGAVFNGTPYKSGTSPTQYDITLRGAASVAYNQAVLDAVTNTSITTTTRVTQIVPGSWQQLPAN